MSRLLTLLLSLHALLAPAEALAQQRVAVLELTGDALDEDAMQFLADKVRSAALRHMDPNAWEVMTRENMLVLLESNAGSLEQCVGECEVQTGQLIGAHLVVAGSVLKFGSTYEAILRSYDTSSGRLLRSEEVSARDLDGLKTGLEDACARLFGGGGASGQTAQVVDEIIDGGHSATASGATTRHVIRFETDPPGAAVSIDGNWQCETDCSKALAEGSGGMGVILHRPYLGNSKGDTAAAVLAAQILHVRSVAGNEAVFLGSDLCTAISPLVPVSEFPALVVPLAKELARQGMDAGEIDGVLYRNALRVLEKS